MIIKVLLVIATIGMGIDLSHGDILWAMMWVTVIFLTGMIWGNKSIAEDDSKLTQ